MKAMGLTAGADARSRLPDAIDALLRNPVLTSKAGGVAQSETADRDRAAAGPAGKNWRCSARPKRLWNGRRPSSKSAATTRSVWFRCQIQAVLCRDLIGGIELAEARLAFSGALDGRLSFPPSHGGNAGSNPAGDATV